MPSAATVESLTDCSSGDADINYNFASLVDDINKLRADNAALRTALVGTIDYCDALKAKINELLVLEFCLQKVDLL